MRYLKLCFLTFVSFVSFFQSSVSKQAQRLLIDQLRWEFLKLEDELWNSTIHGLYTENPRSGEEKLAKKFYEFDIKLKEMPENTLYGVNPLRSIPDFIFVYSDLKTIENLYNKFREYQNDNMNRSGESDLEKIAMEDLSYDILNKKHGAKTTMENLYTKTFYGDGNIVGAANKMVSSNNYWCLDYQQSPQQLFYNLYNTVALADLKSYIMQQFIHLGSSLWEKGNNLKMSLEIRKNYTERVRDMQNHLRMPLKLSKEVWKCDPELFRKGINFDEFTRVLQGHIENEADLSDARTCKETCNSYPYTKSYGCYDWKSDFCKKVPRCNGKIIGCFYVEYDATICVSESYYRRYDYINYHNGPHYGKHKSCPNQRSADSWWRWFVRCHYCMCLCEEHGAKSDRYINLRPVVSNVSKNMVVTGLRFVKHNRLLHIQIQEGKLMPYGRINQSTVRWVPLDNYKITDPGVKNGQDFFTMTYEKRAMAMDEIRASEEFRVVTGVRFEEIGDKLHFVIRVSPFNWENGTVYEKNSYNIYESNAYGRQKIDLKDADIPTLTFSQSEPKTSHTNLYVEFTHTSFKKDAAQTTIPFIDVQEVVNNPAVPLVGAGVYYKGNKGMGGFIAPKIMTYDFGAQLSEATPKMAERTEKLIVEKKKDSMDNISVEVN